MKREIIFRGKTLTDKWVEGAYYKQEFFYGDKEDADVIITSKETLDNDFALESHIVLPETVGQYTGLTDKNGTKIFEGDIVKENGDAEDTLYEIRWVDACFEQRDITLLFGYLLERGSDLEIIGNIHDNPKLLGAKNF